MAHLSSADHVKLITDQHKPTFRGGLAYQERAARPTGGGGGDVHSTMLTELLGVVPRPSELVPKYQHPGRSKDRNRGGGPLTQTDHALLTRLPTDPAKVSFDDAAWLSSLVADVSPIKHSADARLLDSYWKPVAAIHDAKAADVELQNALNTPASPVVPKSMRASLTAAILREEPALTASEADGRAKKKIEGAIGAFQDRRATTIADARLKAKPAQ